ncbi:MAG: hypothetical protein ACK5MY_15345 [Jhaorihella sp.]
MAKVDTVGRDGWMIYGAYGFTGKLVVVDALRQGRKPVFAGRSLATLEPLAEAHGLSVRAFSVDEAADHLDGVGGGLDDASVQSLSRPAGPVRAPESAQ